MSFKRGFSEADQEALANSSHGAREHRKRFPRCVPACGVCVCVHARACASASFRVRRPCTTVGAGRRESSLGKRTRETPLLPRVCTPRFLRSAGLTRDPVPRFYPAQSAKASAEADSAIAAMGMEVAAGAAGTRSELLGERTTTFRPVRQRTTTIAKTRTARSTRGATRCSRRT